jgi:hypothetical protein
VSPPASHSLMVMTVPPPEPEIEEKLPGIERAVTVNCAFKVKERKEQKRKI